MKPKPANGIPLRSSAAPAWMSEGDDRITCTTCRHRNGSDCTALKLPAFPDGLRHRCRHYK